MTREELFDSMPTIREGKAVLLFDKESDTSVFYNPAQEFNRDLTITVLKSWSQLRTQELLEKAKSKDFNGFNTENGLAPFTCLDALSATGLRAIRYAKEIPELDYVVANDYNPTAVEYLKRNQLANGISDKKLVISNSDANYVMYRHAMLGCPFDVIDLDPYGTASPFLEAAISSISDGGLLCVTCTDMICLGGRQPSSCFTKYGGISVPQSPYCHEIALRIVLQTIATISARHKKAIEPLVSASADFYIRLFVRIHKRPAACKLLSNQLGVAYCCTSCTSFALQPFGKASPAPDGKHLSVHGFPATNDMVDGLKFGPAVGPPVNRKCGECGGSFHLAGPLYLPALHNSEFLGLAIKHVQAAGLRNELQQHKSVECLLTLMSLELEDCPFFYRLQHITRFMHLDTPSLNTVYSALLNGGYRVSPTHCATGSFKTNAPASFVFDVLKKHMESHNKLKYDEKVAHARSVLTSTPEKASPGMHCLAREFVHSADLSTHESAGSAVRGSKSIKYPTRPKNWGPKARASSHEAKPCEERTAHKRNAAHPIELAKDNKEYLPPNFNKVASQFYPTQSAGKRSRSSNDTGSR